MVLVTLILGIGTNALVIIWAPIFGGHSVLEQVAIFTWLGLCFLVVAGLLVLRRTAQNHEESG